MTDTKKTDALVEKSKRAALVNSLVKDKGMNVSQASKAAKDFLSKPNPDIPKDPFGTIPG
jgi:uncharacterized protein (DUF2384 family)